METAVESIMPLATAAEQTLDVGLPSTPIHVYGDGTRLVQIFANILNNAVKFTPRGGHIRFTAAQQSDEAVVSIRDTGIGIAPEALSGCLICSSRRRRLSNGRRAAWASD